MEDVLGGRTDPTRFTAFLGNWQTILARWVDAAVAAFATVEGVIGLVLAGSVGRNEPWPLSDIDLLPIYDDAQINEARVEFERRRMALLAPWITEGWWTGLDIGRLAFGRTEVASVLSPGGPRLVTLLDDDRWYHALDKGYRGQAAHDSEGVATILAQWFTTHRFDAATVSHRLARDHREVVTEEQQVWRCLAGQDAVKATVAVRSAVKWLQTGLLESWGERDTSLGRVGTRFARLATARGRADLVNALNALSDLDGASVRRRMATAADWVAERHDRSWRARRHVGETVTWLEDARDMLRVSALYAARRVQAPPYPASLAIPTEVGTREDKAECLTALVRRWIAETP